LICIPSGMGMAWAYMGLVPHLDPRIPVVGPQMPTAFAFDGDQLTLDQLMRHFVDRIREIQPHGPYHLVGYSAGTLMGHAIATFLQSQGEEVAFLALIDSYPVTPGDPGTYEAPKDDLSLTLEILEKLLERPMQHAFENETDPGKALARLVADGTITHEEAYWVTRCTRCVQLNVRLMPSYSHARFDGDVLFFSATTTNWNTDNLRSPEEWAPYVTGRITAHQLSARHDQLMRADNTEIMGRIINEHLLPLVSRSSRILTVAGDGAAEPEPAEA